MSYDTAAEYWFSHSSLHILSFLQAARHKSHGDRVSESRELSDSWQHPVGLGGGSRDYVDFTNKIKFCHLSHVTGGQSQAKVYSIILDVGTSANLSILSGRQWSWSGYPGQPANWYIRFYSLRFLRILCIRFPQKRVWRCIIYRFISQNWSAVNMLLSGPVVRWLNDFNRCALITSTSEGTPPTSIYYMYMHSAHSSIHISLASSSL